MLQSQKYIIKELSDIYPKEEIKSFIAMIFNYLKGYSLTDIIVNNNEIISLSEFSKIVKIVDKLKMHIPIQYIFEEAIFCYLKFKVNKNVLIPRPETEELVEWIIADNKEFKYKNIFDACTGSGCIAISLKKVFPLFDIVACDISQEALDVAKFNNNLNNTSVKFINLDILNYQNFNTSNKFDVIVSNPPYVLNSEKKLMLSNVINNEPHLALFVNDLEPLIFYTQIAKFGVKYLNNNGFIYFEINEAFADECKKELIKIGYRDVEIRKDFLGKDRMIRAKLDN